MMFSEFDRIHDRRLTDSVKWGRYAGRDILPMWVADSEFAAPAPVLKALHERIEHGIFGYGRPDAGLLLALRQWCRSRYDWQPDAAGVLFVPGLVAALHHVVRAFAPPDVPVLVPTPVYPPFFEAVHGAGREVKAVPLTCHNGRWILTADALANACQGKGQLLLFCNPHNPTGTVYRSGELAVLAEVARDHDLLVCSDEIHCDLILEPGLSHQPLAALNRDIASRTITLMAPSKSFNIAGLGCSYALIEDSRLRTRFKHAIHGVLPACNLLALVAAEAALREGSDWLAEQCRYLRGNRDVVNLLWRDLGVPHTEPEATYLSWIDLRPFGISDPMTWFEQHGVGLSDGGPFGAPGHLRLNFGCSREQLHEGLLRCRNALISAGVQPVA